MPGLDVDITFSPLLGRGLLYDAGVILVFQEDFWQVEFEAALNGSF